MSIIEKLSSQSGQKTEEANKLAAQECIANPALIEEIVGNLQSKDAKLAGDCAEVCTMVALTQPQLIAPFAEILEGIRLHRATRVRWEAAHSLALTASQRPDLMAGLLPGLLETIRHDESIIVRDYSIDILAGFASTGPAGARTVFQALVEALQVWDGRHAGHALAGLEHTARQVPDLRTEIQQMIQPFLSSGRQVIRKAASRVEKACR